MPNVNATLEICPVDGRAETIFGYGVNCITGGVVIGDNCVENVVTKAQPRSQDNLWVKVVKNGADFSDFMNTNATVSVSGLSWSATASVANASQNAATDTSMSYVAVRDVRSSDVYLDITKATISPAALDLLNGPNGPSQFIAKYGTHCVIGVSYGGSFSGYIRLNTSSAAHKESVAASMSVSATGFGVKGSVNADFSTGLSEITTNYDLTCNSSTVGGATSGFNRTDPDGMLQAAQNITLVDNPGAGSGVKGAPIAFICVTWDQFAQIQTALNHLNQPNALSLGSALGVLSQLSAEYSALNYVIGTCRSIITSGDFAIPAQRGLAGRLMTAAVTGQHAIQSLSLSQVQNMTPATLQGLQVSSRLMGHVNPLSHNAVRVNVEWFTDGAFDASGDHSATVNVPFNTMPSVISVQHHNFEGVANLYVHVGNDPMGNYLTTRWYWNDSALYDSPRVDIGGDNINTTPAKASWTGAAWNYIQANLIDYQP